MVFNSIEFLLFFVFFFLIYWFLAKTAMQQNLLLLLGSCFFYAWWNLSFLILLLSITSLIYFLALGMTAAKTLTGKKALLNLGLFCAIGLLFVFKYYDFFIASLQSLLAIGNFHVSLLTLHLILPLGISFYSFRLISYLLDVYYEKMDASTNWINFTSYVIFFPTVISGPIDRPNPFLEQLKHKRIFTVQNGTDGVKQIFWGLFKKVLIADKIAPGVDTVFSNYHQYTGSTLFITAFLFAIQLYTDFSGYSDMAIGIGKLLGIKVAKNFDHPFFAQNIAAFWRRWHISLTSWLTDYIFTPLSIQLRDWDKKGTIIAIIINFTICGIWHGANWTYVLFGFLHGCYFIPLILKGTLHKKTKIAAQKKWPSVRELINMLQLFILLTFTWIIFKSNSLADAFGYYRQMVWGGLFKKPDWGILCSSGIFGLIVLTLVFEWHQQKLDYAFKEIPVKKPVVRYLIYNILIAFLLMGLLKQGEHQFIYFKF